MSKPIKKRKGSPQKKGALRYITTKGYVFIKMPDHHRANGVGYVLEHIVVLEKKLGREIKVEDGEVHHKDSDRSNNDPDNLMLLTMLEHRALHRIQRGNEVKPRKNKPARKRPAPTGSDKVYTSGKNLKVKGVIPKEKLPRGYYYLKII